MRNPFFEDWFVRLCIYIKGFLFKKLRSAESIQR